MNLKRKYQISFLPCMDFEGSKVKLCEFLQRFLPGFSTSFHLRWYLLEFLELWVIDRTEINLK